MSSSVLVELWIKTEHLEREGIAALIDGATPETRNDEWAHFLLPNVSARHLELELMLAEGLVFAGLHDPCPGDFGSHCFYSDGETTAEWESGFGGHTLCVDVDDPKNFKKAKEFFDSFRGIIREALESFIKSAAQEKEA